MTFLLSPSRGHDQILTGIHCLFAGCDDAEEIVEA
jgi:hypothetical protein